MTLIFLTSVGLEIQHNNCAPIQNHFHKDDFDQWTSATACVVGEGLLSRY